MKKVILFLLVCLPFFTLAQVKDVKHVVLIGVDGLGGNYLNEAEDIPNIRMMMKEGSYTMHARCVRPSSSAVNWATMTMGAVPSLTGYTEWNTQSSVIQPKVTDSFGMFPSIFSLLREQQPSSNIGVIYTWSGIGFIFPHEAVNYSKWVGLDYDSSSDDKMVELATEYIKKNKPNLLFTYFHRVDLAGHGSRWSTPEYFDAIKQVDKGIGEILKAVKEAGMMDNTIFILSADHGGLKKSHGGDSMLEIEIPWIIYGQGVKKQNEIEESVMNFDTASTIAYILGLKQPQVWVGRPVKSVFLNKH